MQMTWLEINLFLMVVCYFELKFYKLDMVL